MLNVLTFARPVARLVIVLLPWLSPAFAEPPKRVVSMNTCTDQLAMLVAGKGQLYSVSYLAADPSASALSSAAADYVVNHGLAEEIFLMKPDLVLASSFSARATVEMLRRLGFQVEEFTPERSFDDVRSNLRRMGALLGQAEKANQLTAELDAKLALLADDAPSGKTVALYHANSYTSGMGTLASAIVDAAGIDNLADRLGVHGVAKLPLEALVLSDVDLIAAEPDDHYAPSLANQNFMHPAYQAIAARLPTTSLESRHTVCGGPFNADAARMIQEAAR